MMKRNESILVYGVAGLLLVILLVAVVFGNEEALARPGEGDDRAVVATDDAVRELAELLNLDPAAALDGEAAEQSEAAGPPEADPQTEEVEGVEEVEGSGAADGEETNPLLEGTDPPKAEGESSPEDAAAGAVDVSGRVGDYREVTVRRGDTFSMLVRRWTGSLDRMELVEALNEDVEKHRLREGRKLLVPWVDEETLRADRDERLIASAKRDAATATPGQVYKLKSGDSLWKIAVLASGTKAAAAGYVARIMELNPGLVPEKLQVGQEITLPK